MVIVAGLTAGAVLVHAAEEAADDALIKALNAEIKQVDKEGGDKAAEKASDAVADSDSVEIAPSSKRSAKAGRKARAVSSDEEHRPVRKRAAKDSKVLVVIVRGKGETLEEAKLAAFRAAVEKAVGIYVDAESMMKNSELLKDRVNTISNADIKEYETIKKGKTKDGLYAIQIKAKVEKKAIAPKFADVFPAAFANVGKEAETIHVQKVTRTKRSEDAASLMTAALEGVDRMRKWTRLSVVKGKGLEEVKKIGNQDVAEVPGKGLYSVRYSIKIDEDAYFKGFLPHFKQVLSKMQEGEAEEEVVLTSGPIPTHWQRAMGGDDSGYTHFVDPVVLSGFPETAIGGIRGKGDNPEFFMFDQFKGLAKVQKERSYNIWLLVRMNKDRSSVRCSAYKVPISALKAYWKSLYGELDSSYVMHDLKSLKMRNHEKVEVVLLDEDGEEIAAQVDGVSTALLASGYEFNDKALRYDRSTDASCVQKIWEKSNVFNSFFIRPMFARDLGLGRFGYSTEIQRKVYFPLTDEQLEKVKRVKVRYVGGGKKRK